MTKPITHASLFSGIGGPEVAAEMLGWENLFHCEINPFGKAVLDYWFPKSKSYEDITKTDFQPWRGRVSVLTGGFPCQPFSYAGRRAGREDERYLWPEMLRAIDEIRPTWVVGENVAGITTMVEGGVCVEMGSQSTLFGEDNNLRRYELKQSFTIERICRDLEHLGYSVQPLLIPAAAVGAPHRRDRIFIVAFNADAYGGNDLRKPGENEGTGSTERVQERNEVRELGEPDNIRPYGTNSQERFSPNAFCFGRRDKREYDNGQPSESQQNKRGKFKPFGTNSAFDRWRGFPTVPPVHRGNDGLPFNVDDLTISPSRWRTESLKAYGNAIVPQVIYEIFLQIQNLNNQDNK